MSDATLELIAAGLLIGGGLLLIGWSYLITEAARRDR